MDYILLIGAVIIFVAMLILFKFLRRTLLFIVLAVALIYIIYRLGWFGETINEIIRQVGGLNA